MGRQIAAVAAFQRIPVGLQLLPDDPDGFLFRPGSQEADRIIPSAVFSDPLDILHGGFGPFFGHCANQGTKDVPFTDAAADIIDMVDVVVLAQGSMAYAEEHLRAVYGKPFLGSPRFGAAALKAALQSKGVL